MLFLCGQGPAAEHILRFEYARKQKVMVFTHDGADLARIAHELGVWYTTENVNDAAAWPGQPSLIASVCYLHIVKPALIEYMQGKIFNCHAALLPSHRGRSAVPWALVNGDSHIGITYHWIDSGIDTGPIILQAARPITPHDTQDTLFAKVYQLMADFWYPARHLAQIGWPGVPQPQGGFYHQAGPPYGGTIDADWPIEKIDRFIRAMTLQGKAPATYHGQEVRSIGDYERLRTDPV